MFSVGLSRTQPGSIGSRGRLKPHELAAFECDAIMKHIFHSFALPEEIAASVETKGNTERGYAEPPVPSKYLALLGSWLMFSCRIFSRNVFLEFSHGVSSQLIDEKYLFRTFITGKPKNLDNEEPEGIGNSFHRKTKFSPAKSIKNSIMISRSRWGKATLGLSVCLNQIHLPVDHDLRRDRFSKIINP
jgi:hypothetical protein